MKHLVLITITSFLTCKYFAQINTSKQQDYFLNNMLDTTQAKTKNPHQKIYTTKLKVDAPIIASGVAMNLVGYKLISTKKDLTPEQLASKKIDNIPFFDRSSAGWYNKDWDKISYYPFQGAFAVPVLVMLIDKDQRKDFGQLMTLYFETMVVTGGTYTLCAGVFDRSRPFVYGTLAPYDQRVSGQNQRSFMSGHTASTTAAMIFTAKVFADYHSNSKLKPYIWGVSIGTSVLMGYMRYKAGMHFISDNVAGFATGYAVGYLVPQLHKKKILPKNVTVIPFVGDSKGLAFTYKF